MVKVVIMKPVADGQAGEVVVSFTASSPARNVRLTVEPVLATGTPRLLFVPDAVHGGYLLPEVAAGTPIDRLFSVKPVDAEAGTDHQCVAYARFCDGSEEASTAFTIHVEARPEVYAALGAVEHLRRVLIGAYDSLKQLGKEVHRNSGTVLPTAPRDAVRETLHPDTVQWALDMIEQGTRQFTERPARRRRKS